MKQWIIGLCVIMLASSSIDIKQEIKKELFTVIVQSNQQYCTDQQQKQCEFDAIQINQALSKLQNIVNLVNIDCQDNNLYPNQECSNQQRSHKIYIRISEQEIIEYKGAFLEQLIVSQINQKMTDFTVPIQQEAQLYEFFRLKRLPKILIFGKKQEAPLMLKLLSTQFRDRIQFGYVNSKQQVLLQKYNVTDLPTIVSFVFDDDRDNYQKDQFKGEVNLNNVQQFAQKIGLEQRISENQRQEIFDLKEKEQKEKESMLIDAMELTKGKLQKMKEDERAILLFVYEDREQLVKGGFVDKMKKLGDLVQIAIVKVDQKEFKRKSIRFMPMGGAKEKENWKEWKYESSLEQIIELLYENIEDNSRKMNAADYQLQLQTTFQKEKIPMILLYEKGEVLLSFRVFTNMKKYQKTIDFYSWKDPIMEIRQSGQQNTRLPHIKYMFRAQDSQQEGAVNVAAYTGKIHYNNMIQLFMTIQQQLGIQIEPNYQQQQQNNRKKMVKIDSKDKMNECFNGKHLYCFVVLVNEEIRDEEDEKMVGLMESSKLQKIREKYSEDMYYYGFIDIVCHSYLLEYVEIDLDSVPQLLVIYPTKMQYSRQIGTFSYENLSIYLQNVMKQRVQVYKLDEGFKQFRDGQDCQQLRESAQAKQVVDEDDDDFMQEILEKERLKKEQIAKEIEQEGIYVDKKKKKKKGSQKTDL